MQKHQCKKRQATSDCWNCNWHVKTIRSMAEVFLDLIVLHTRSGVRKRLVPQTCLSSKAQFGKRFLQHKLSGFFLKRKWPLWLHFELMHSSWSDFLPQRREIGWVGRDNFYWGSRIYLNPPTYPLNQGNSWRQKTWICKISWFGFKDVFQVWTYTVWVTSLTWNKITENKLNSCCLFWCFGFAGV